MDSEKNGDDKITASRGNFVVLTWRTRLCYGVGHILNDLCGNIWFSYLLLYFHEVVKLGPVTAGSLLLVGQITDALATPVVGIESDKTGNCRYGRRKTWHLAGICCVALSFPFIFIKCIGCHDATEEYAKVIYYVPFIVIFQIGWAITQISHLSMIPELSKCKIEKVTLNAIRYACTVSSGIFVFGVMWFLIMDMETTSDIGPTDHKEFKFLALIVVGVGLLFMVIYHIGIKEKPRLNYSTENGKGRRNAKNWKLWFKDQQFYKVGLIYMCTRLIVNISQVYIPLYTKIHLQQKKEIIAIVPFTVFLSGFVTTFISKPLNVHLGSKATYVLGLLIIVANCVWCHFLPRQSKQVYGFAIALGVGGTLSLVTCLSMLAQLIGENVETGAFVYGAMSFLDKLANGAAVQIIQLFHPTGTSKECKIDCGNFYQSIMTYVPGVAAVLALLITATLIKQDIGAKVSGKDKEPLLSQNRSVQNNHKPYEACQTKKDLEDHKQLRRSSWESAKDNDLI